MSAEPPTTRRRYSVWFVAVGLVFAVGLLVNPPIPPQIEKWRCVNGAWAAVVERWHGDTRRHRLGWLLVGATLVFGFYDVFLNVRAAVLAGPGAW
jgi:hypothetical protein